MNPTNIRLCKKYTKVTRWCGCSGPSRIVVYGGGDIVFDTKRSNQWMQYTVDAVCSRIVVYDGRDIVFGAKRSNQWIQWMQSQSAHST